jgi:hypothetical protein
MSHIYLITFINDILLFYREGCLHIDMKCHYRPEYTDRAIEVGGTREGQSFVLKV